MMLLLLDVFVVLIVLIMIGIKYVDRINTDNEFDNMWVTITGLLPLVTVDISQRYLNKIYQLTLITSPQQLTKHP